MRFLQMPPQIVRLVLLTIGIVGTYLGARYFLTPQSFGQNGWYRAAAPEEIASRDRVFAGRKACEECHSDIEKKLVKAEHKGLSCEACHGAALAHVNNPDVEVPPGKNRLEMFGACIRCHDANVSRPGWLKQITAKTHYPGRKCTECHVPHQPNEVPND